MITMQMQGKRRRGNKRWLDNIRKGMKECNMTEEVAENRNVWHMNINAGQSLDG